MAIIFKIEPKPAMLLYIPGLALVCVDLVFDDLTVVAILSTRYCATFQPIVGTVIQLGMFATPIMWPISSLGDARIVAEINPIITSSK